MATTITGGIKSADAQASLEWSVVRILSGRVKIDIAKLRGLRATLPRFPVSDTELAEKLRNWPSPRIYLTLGCA